ncbi:hypothetical protein [Actinoplanes subtropicus]|uniref:hypothetical protein n=1 Tax=Actinoplanes subtropicus TaxID=543632 RepID=UPI0004C3D295|nr:hypothetical protein [Actinoplanes subtropicus]
MSAPVAGRITGALAGLACAACCALPPLIAAGVVTTTGAALLRQTLIAVAAGLAVVALGLWWLHRRCSAGAAATCGCGCQGTVCSHEA